MTNLNGLEMAFLDEICCDYRINKFSYEKQKYEYEELILEFENFIYTMYQNYPDDLKEMKEIITNLKNKNDK